MTEPIDLVYAWCDDTDEKWRAKKGDEFEPLKEQRIFCARFREKESAR